MTTADTKEAPVEKVVTEETEEVVTRVVEESKVVKRVVTKETET